MTLQAFCERLGRALGLSPRHEVVVDRRLLLADDDTTVCFSCGFPMALHFGGPNCSGPWLGHQVARERFLADGGGR